jgi:uncharacterized membrane protein YeaQ/YmgE (transglycosylase-associated protein family)
MSLMLAILIGIVIGAFAEFILPGHTMNEFVLTGLLGIAGSLITRFVGQRAGWFGTDDPQCVVAEILGAIILLVLYGVISRRHSRDHPVNHSKTKIP